MIHMNEHLTSFKTSWGSDIAPFVQKRIIKRIKLNDTIDQIIQEELLDLLDSGSDSYDEAHEIYTHCENLLQQHTEQ